MTHAISRRGLAKFAGIVAAPFAAAAEEERLQSQFLLRLVLQAMPPNTVGNRLIVSVAGGSFEGPRLKGTIVSPSGDWIVRRPDGANVLDVRLLLQTDDREKIYMSWRGLARPLEGTLRARITPVFETGAGRYSWLNDVVSVGVYQPGAGGIAYRVYEIL